MALPTAAPCRREVRGSRVGIRWRSGAVAVGGTSWGWAQTGGLPQPLVVGAPPRFGFGGRTREEVGRFGEWGEEAGRGVPSGHLEVGPVVAW